MTSFGRYETVLELHRSGFTVLYSGRIAAGPEAKFAIKVFQPSILLLETEQAETESDLFLNSANVQQKTTASGAQYWAPIYECGSIPDGAFYATDKYDRSLQQLIDVRIALSSQALRKIVESAAKGLVELKQACGRPHGNLKTTNILIAGEGDISQTTIVLSDPLPDEHIEKAEHWDNDLRDIGEFIYQLVIHRPSPNVDGWQVPDSKEWAKLGKQAKDWRNLCNRLLNAHMKPGTMTIETLIEELARLEKIKPVLSFRRLLIATGLVVIAGAAVFIIKPDIFPSKSANIKDWKQLFTEYVGLVEDLRSDLGLPNGNEREKLWKNNPDLSIIVEKVNKASYPYYIAYDNNVLEEDLNKIETEEDIDDFNIKEDKTIDALIAIEIIKYFFDPKADPNSFRFYNDPNSPANRKEYQKWPLLVEIHDTANSFTKRGWQRSATYLQRLVDDIKPDPNIVVENVDKILELQPTLDDMKSYWTKIEDNQKTIERTGEPILSRFLDYINQEPALGLGEADVNDVCKKLHDELWKIEQLSSDLAKSIEDNWKKLEENQNIIKSTGNPTLAKFPDYLQSKLASADLDILGSELEQISSLADKLAKFVEDNWQKLEDNQKTVENTGDPILAKFPDYIQSKLASADMDMLDRELEQISSLADELAKFNWQKVDKEAFLNDHGNDSEETLTNNTFIERLVVIKDYYYLDPDPRDELIELIDRIEGNMPLARLSNPVEANICAENLKILRQDIKEIEETPAIEKYRSNITDAVDIHKPKLKKLEERIIAATETPEKYHQRIRKQIVLSAEASEEINKKWLTFRDSLLDSYPLPALKESLGKYAELRQKIDDTTRSLVKLNEELQTELPSKLEVEVKELDWNNKLKQFFDQERKETIIRIVENIPLQDEIPDISDLSFKQFSRTQFSKFQQLQVDLGGILEAFNKIEAGLDGCYLLSDKLPVIDETIQSLWGEWEHKDILKDPSINNALAELTKRIKDLEEIDKSNDRDRLGKIAIEPNSQNEAIYAAWTRLGELTDLQWPDTDQEWARDKEIQEVLRAKLLTIKGENRAIELGSTLEDVSLKREKIYRGANIRRHKTVVKSKSSADPVLAKFETLEPYDADADLSDVVDFESLAKVLAEFVTDPNWPTKFRTDLFIDESPIYKKTSLTKNDFQEWMEEIKGYHKLENDPRNNYSWEERIIKIEELIGKELVRKQDGVSLVKLRNLKSNFDTVKSTINDMRLWPAIEKHKDQILEAGDYWEKLLEIEKKLKPEYCKRIELENGRLIFATSSLRSNFEPIDVDNKKPVTLTTGWEQIRQAVKGKQKEWLDFFYIIDGNDTQNTGWPRYARFTKDPSITIRFIPADGDNPEPFYMATHETTNAQYRAFLEKSGAISRTNRPGWSWFIDQSNKDLIVSQSKDVPPCAIKWDGSRKAFTVAQEDADIPVTYVTYHGAQSYAESIGTLLPTVSQHKYACKAGNNIIPPWANQSEISSYAHVRAGPWQNAAAEYNSKVGTADEIPPPPIGAVRQKDFTPYETKLDFDIEKFFPNETDYNSAWPIAGANKPNRWGLYDMIGNVWEWCTNDNGDAQSVICGGSCLAPPEYLVLETESNYKYIYNERASDVGFRIIVPAK